ncbi:MAG TPA: chromate efflux transporter [Aquella sp.]|nr:chromate efflux transporter [Aquella sp.]
MLKLFLIFTRLGCIGFGGPIALVALIEQTVCKEHKWLDAPAFAEIFSICKLLPGPVAVQVAICVGYRRYGRLGGFIAGLGFTLPAIILMIILSILYMQNGTKDASKTLYVFKFMQDATLAVILLAIWDMGKSTVNSWKMILLTLLGAIIIFRLPTYEPLIIIAFGMLGLISSSSNKMCKTPIVAASSMPFSIWHGILLAGGISMMGQLLWIFIKAGEFSFGTGLAIIPLLHGDLVIKYHWLTNKQFLDGMALGQMTPGPTTVSVVFFGYTIAGLIGVLIALVGFYVPALFNTLILMPIFWEKLTSTRGLHSFLRFAFPAIIGGIVSSSIKLGVVAMTNWYDYLVFLVALAVVKKKLLPIWAIIPLCGVIGLLLTLHLS